MRSFAVVADDSDIIAVVMTDHADAGVLLWLILHN